MPTKNGQPTKAEVLKENEALYAEIQHRDAVIENNAELLQERIAELELALEDEGWRRLGVGQETEFSRAGLGKIIAIARLMYLKNPLIRRGVNIQSYYVWGQGVDIKADDEADNETIQQWLQLPDNRKVFSGHQARVMQEVMLQIEGNRFFALFAGTDGQVRVRVFPTDEIIDIVCNPEDRTEAQWYLRKWTERGFNAEGGIETKTRQAWYPDWQLEGDLPESIGDTPVVQIPIYHVKVGGTDSMRFGVPDVYAALDWARAYKSYLEDWASIVRSLQRFAWRLTTKGGSKAVASAKTKLGTTLTRTTDEDNPAPTTGSVFIGNEGADLAPINKSGANVKAEDGRMLRLMVASAMDVPDTILSGDPDMGNLATAKTLDRPTELAMRDRQMLWSEVMTDLATWVLNHNRTAATAGVEFEQRGEPGDTAIEVTFPPILEHDVSEQIGAIVSAATLDGKSEAGTLPKIELARMLMVVLGVENVDDLLAEVERMEQERQKRAEEMERLAAAGAKKLENEDDDDDDEIEEETPQQVEEDLGEALRDLRRLIGAATGGENNGTH